MAKKKAAKKKAAKKKTAKKKVKRVVRYEETRSRRRTAEHCVRLHSEEGIVPNVLVFERGDQVCWRNETAFDREISFPDRILRPNENPVVIGPGETSRLYKLKGGLESGKYRYSVTPNVPDGAPPDGPAVDYQG